MINFGKGVVKLRIPILIVSIILLFPAALGYFHTRVNYDILTYLPKEIDTMKGQDILLDEFGTGAFSMCVVEGMEDQDISKMRKNMEKVDHVKKILWYDSLADLSIPKTMLPDKVQDAFINEDKDATLMVIFFDSSMSSDETMDAIEELRSVADKQCYISGMSAVVTDTKNLSDKEVPIYVLIAVILAVIVLSLTMDSALIPVFFLLSIGIAIIYNLGSNVFLGQVSYITKALTAVLQLGVTMDYSIFLLNSYEEYKEKYTEDRNRAMGHAIASTFKAVVGSSVTTVAGFAALCFMTFALGRDLGIVMAKGVIIGVICCVTILPSLILAFDKQIEKTKHRPLIKSVDGASNFIIKHHWVWLIVFLVLLLPAVHGNNNIKIYYDIAKSMPSSLPSNVATDRLKKDFNMSTIHMVMMDSNMDSKDKRDMLKEIDNVEGVKWTISMSSLVGASVPESMIPKDVKSMLQSGDHELAFICSEYESATPKVNKQIAKINKITKNYDKTSMVIGEAPLMKDLEDVTNIDIQNVNVASIAAIFVIILIIFKSISLPVILVAIIEFAIAVNMAVPYYQGVSLPFVASIVIGTIQLGATVDYAIVYTNRYLKERRNGKNKLEAISIAHKSNMLSIITSALSLFAATYGVACYSQVDMIGSICTLLARGAIISMIVVLTLLPTMFLIFDKAICKTTKGMGHIDDHKDTVVNDIVL